MKITEISTLSNGQHEDDVFSTHADFWVMQSFLGHAIFSGSCCLFWVMLSFLGHAVFLGHADFSVSC